MTRRAAYRFENSNITNNSTCIMSHQLGIFANTNTQFMEVLHIVSSPPYPSIKIHNKQALDVVLLEELHIVSYPLYPPIKIHIHFVVSAVVGSYFIK